MKAIGAIIGGTGILSSVPVGESLPVCVPTADGLVRGLYLKERRVFFFPRHGGAHKVPPHRVPYRGLALAARMLRVPRVVSTGAVGSLRSDLPAGSIVACSDLLDFSARNLTLYESSVVHTDMTHPFDPALRHAFRKSAEEVSERIEENGVYVCVNGPRYETPAEIAFYRQAGGDVIGMTVGSEAIAMREAGVPYACLACVTNLAAGLSPGSLSHEEVVANMDTLAHRLLTIIFRTLEAMDEDAGKD
ncbi:MAG: S-methyl-5'-thioadenosine phosphorylase [Armatimonadetes bacterium]|nr:MAG: S-methyl-5'-thioadenosine phosphorylase [Armatimonadota bacterium]